MRNNNPYNPFRTSRMAAAYAFISALADKNLTNKQKDMLREDWANNHKKKKQRST